MTVNNRLDWSQVFTKSQWLFGSSGGGWREARVVTIRPPGPGWVVGAWTAPSSWTAALPSRWRDRKPPGPALGLGYTGMIAGDGLLQWTGKLCYNYNVSADQLSDVTPAAGASWAETVHYGTREQDAAFKLWAHHCILAVYSKSIKSNAVLHMKTVSHLRMRIVTHWPELVACLGHTKHKQGWIFVISPELKQKVEKIIILCMWHGKADKKSDCQVSRFKISARVQNHSNVFFLQQFKLPSKSDSPDSWLGVIVVLWWCELATSGGHQMQILGPKLTPLGTESWRASRKWY